MMRNPKFRITCVLILGGFLLITPAKTLSAQPAYEFLLESSKQKKTGKVQKILAPHIFRIEDNVTRQSETVQLIGLKADFFDERRKRLNTEDDTSGQPVYPDQQPFYHWQTQARLDLNDLLLDREIHLESDSIHKSDDGHTLAYAFLEETGLLINAEVLSRGYAELSIQPPNLKYADKLRAAYREARGALRGIHNF